MFRYLTAGESHGKALCAVIEGLPSGLEITGNSVNRELARRQLGYGRGPRMGMEKDEAEIISGLRGGMTIGSPLCLIIKNRARTDWQSSPPVTGLRPGHADLAGALKYGHRDIANVLERSSARETAARTAAGACAGRFLEEMGVRILSHVIRIGETSADGKIPDDKDSLKDIIDSSPVRCLDKSAEERMKAEIDKAGEAGDTLGGVFEIIASGVPPGLGSFVHWDRKLDSRLAGALMSIQAIKGVEIGLGFGCAGRPGSEVMDAINCREGVFTRPTNNAGGIEGGMTNGEPVVIRAAMKPIPTLRKPLKSADLVTGEDTDASVHRSDVCAVPAAAVVGEAAAAIELMKCFQEKFGADSMDEIRRNYKSYMEALKP